MEQSQPSPALIFQTLNAHQRTMALKGAIELNLFTAIGEGNRDVASIAKRCAVSERGARILCDYMTINGFLTKEGSTYGLTQDSAIFLDSRSPAYMGTATRFLATPIFLDYYKDVAAIVRKGGTVLKDEGTMAPDDSIWVDFARGMAPMMYMAAEAIAEVVQAKSGPAWKILDIAAGHGIFGITLAKHNPNAKVVGQDWAAVLEVALENARAAKVDDRYSTVPGSAFDVDFGNGYDLILLTNFLHHFDPPTNEKLLRKVHAALKEGGRAVTLEFIPNDDRITPPGAAAFSMMMLGCTEGGDAYTFAELDTMFRNAGFARSEVHPPLPSDQRIVVSYK